MTIGATTARDGGTEVTELLHALSFSDEGRADPYPLVERLHEHGDMASMPGYVAAFSYEACESIVRSPSFGRQAPEPTRATWPHELTAQQKAELRAADGEMGAYLTEIDGDQHARLRRLVGRAFTPGRVERMRPAAGRTFDALLDGVTPGTPVDFAQAIAFPYPTEVIGEFVGLSIGDRRWFRDRALAGLPARDPRSTYPQFLVAATARGEMSRYVVELLDERRRRPTDDLVSALIAADDGDDTTATTPEMVALTAILYIAAYVTTADMLTNGLMLLLQHPDALAELRDDPSLVRGAIDEVLRHDNIVVTLDYWAKEDAEVCGHHLPRGTSVHLFLSAANRDPRRFPDPTRFDVRRDDGPSLAFGAGAHYCVGAALARLEGEVAFERLLARFGRWELAATPAPVRSPIFNYRGFESLPVVFTT